MPLFTIFNSKLSISKFISSTYMKTASISLISSLLSLETIAISLASVSAEDTCPILIVWRSGELKKNYSSEYTLYIFSVVIAWVEYN